MVSHKHILTVSKTVFHLFHEGHVRLKVFSNNFWYLVSDQCRFPFFFFESAA